MLSGANLNSEEKFSRPAPDKRGTQALGKCSKCPWKELQEGEFLLEEELA